MPSNPAQVPEFLRFVSHYRPQPIKGQPQDVQKIQGALQRMGNIPRDSRLLSDQIAQKAQIKKGAAQLLLPDLQVDWRTPAPKILTPKEAKIVVPKRYLQKGVSLNDFDDGETWNEMLWDAAHSDEIVRGKIIEELAYLVKTSIQDHGVDSVPSGVMQSYENYLRNPKKWGEQLYQEIEDSGFDTLDVIVEVAQAQADDLVARGVMPSRRELSGTEWDSYSQFQRLPELPGDQYFTSVLRGPPVPKGHELSGASNHFANPSQYGHVRGTYNPSARLIKIDELQSDPLEIDPTDPRLKNIYGQLSKAMIQGAAETDQAGIMFPTAKAIGSVRPPDHSKFYSQVYSRDLQDQLFDPLSDLGISIGKTDDYRGISLDSKAKEILKNNPDFYNYAEGGLVDFPPELSSEINDYLKGTTRRTFRPTKYGNPLEGQHLESFNQDKPIGHMTTGKNIVRGMKEWIPDAAAGLTGDLVDIAAYLPRQAFNSHPTKELPTLGAGNAVRRRMNRIPDHPPEFSEIKDEPLATMLTRLANPLMFMNPKHLANPKVLGALAALHGITDMGLAAGALGVIKPKGGTWNPGYNFDQMIEATMMARPSRVFGQLPRNIQNHTYSMSPGSAINRAKKENPKEWRAALEKVAPVDAWVDRQLRNYLQRDFGAPSDPIRKLYDQGIMHKKFDPLDVDELHQSPGRTIMSTTPEGRMWEDATDSRLSTRPAYEHVKDNPKQSKEDLIRAYNDFEPTMMSSTDYPFTTTVPRKIHPETGELLPEFLSKVPAEEPIYSIMTQRPQNFGFDHLADELTNALRGEASGLPRNLQLTPEAVQNMSVEKAVRRVSDINNWREAQVIEANKAIANNPAVHLLREYPDTLELPNPKGLRWVELKAGELPEGYTHEPSSTGNYQWHYPDPKTGEKMWTSIDPRRQALEPQLKYEGDTMKHCVGGYCDDVLSGEKRIFSLRDANGEPHTTVEVDTTQPWTSWSKTKDAEDFLPALNKKHGTKFDSLTELRDWDKLSPGEVNDLHRNTDDFWDYAHWFAHKRPDLVEPSWYGLDKFHEPGELSIAQIKGKANQKPKDEYLPFVQDFVRNGIEGKSWGKINDFKNTGLVDMGEFTGNHITGYHTPDEAIKAVREFEANNPGTYGAWIDALEKMKAPDGN